MPSAATSMRGAFLNCRFAVNGIQKASRLLVVERVRGASAKVASARAMLKSPPKSRRLGRRPNSAGRPFRLRETARFPDQTVNGKLDSFQGSLKGHHAARALYDRRL